MTLRIGELVRSPAPLLVAASLVAGCQPASTPAPSAPSSPDASSPETPVPSPSDATSMPGNTASNASAEVPSASNSVAPAEPSATAAVPSAQADGAPTSDTGSSDTGSSNTAPSNAQTGSNVRTATPSETHDQPSVGDRGAAASEADRITDSGAVEIIFEDIQLPIQADMVFRPVMLTERAKSLDGKRIRISGYMLPDSKSKNLKEFVLLKNTECKFGPGGQADHLLNVQLKPGTTTDFRDDAVAVEGVLKVNPFQGPDGNTWSIYDLECDLVEKFRPRR